MRNRKVLSPDIMIIMTNAHTILVLFWSAPTPSFFPHPYCEIELYMIRPTWVYDNVLFKATNSKVLKKLENVLKFLNSTFRYCVVRRLQTTTTTITIVVLALLWCGYSLDRHFELGKHLTCGLLTFKFNSRVPLFEMYL